MLKKYFVSPILLIYLNFNIYIHKLYNYCTTPPFRGVIAFLQSCIIIAPLNFKKNFFQSYIIIESLIFN